jgi:hypothetical protein
VNHAIQDDGGMIPDEFSNLVNPEEDTFNNSNSNMYKPKIRGNEHLYEDREEVDEIDIDAEN